MENKLYTFPEAIALLQNDEVVVTESGLPILEKHVGGYGWYVTDATIDNLSKFKYRIISVSHYTNILRLVLNTLSTAGVLRGFEYENNTRKCQKCIFTAECEAELYEDMEEMCKEAAKESARIALLNNKCLNITEDRITRIT